MLGKKWQTENTCDEAFQDNMVADFRHFCVNQDHRFKTFLSQQSPSYSNVVHIHNFWLFLWVLGRVRFNKMISHHMALVHIAGTAIDLK